MEAISNRYGRGGRALGAIPNTSFCLALATGLHSTQRPSDMRVCVEHEPHRKGDQNRNHSRVKAWWQRDEKGRTVRS